MSRAVYLDYNSGAPVRPEVAAAMVEALAEPGNPSSVHGFGRAARARVEAARRQLAGLVGADPAGIVFTSGGTEANALALRGCGRSRLLVSSIEHPSVLDSASEAERVPVTPDGIIDLAALDCLLAANTRPALVSVMLANNETGIVQPVAEAARIIHARGAWLHCDVAQAMGRIKVSLGQLGADILTLSAHKMGGPAGVGALILAESGRTLAPILLGGGQERRRRAGTENVAGIVGLGAAAQSAGDDLAGADTTYGVQALRDRLEEGARRLVPDAVVIGAGAPRLPNTTCLALPGVEGRTQVMALDLAGVAVSAGAACSSGKVAPSHVLAAMGLEERLKGSAIRVSLGWSSRPEDVDTFLAAWADLARHKGLKVSEAA
ncbi:cysteine desulfurase [Magnetospirillum sp. ME-1]|uniref:cysteine desulfurase family protein n=1 Tax=Magnetospirillum sp. ME-1 TaxID=1639348 RepID=UPI000A17EE8D|nr:cysteine desulfurase family protein [Magnetospirillum sp. ME-1]ARJ67554.1 cysteine desulfurase [Magnetospirillum sp. ME-1]